MDVVLMHRVEVAASIRTPVMGRTWCSSPLVLGEVSSGESAVLQG